VDDDCDQRVDDADPGLVGAPTWYADDDHDGFGDPRDSDHACQQPRGDVGSSTDCDDSDPTIHPGAVDVAGDGIDQDCSGSVTCFLDADHDGFGTDTVVDDDGDGVCRPSDGEATRAGDCADAHPDVNPDATEVCNGIDDDCDGVVDLPTCGGTGGGETADTGHGGGHGDDDDNGIPDALQR
jgi:hypothetical protein